MTASYETKRGSSLPQSAIPIAMSRSIATAGLRSSSRRTISWVRSLARTPTQMTRTTDSTPIQLQALKLQAESLLYHQAGLPPLLHFLPVVVAKVSRQRAQIAIWTSLQVTGTPIHKAQRLWRAVFQTPQHHPHFLGVHRVLPHRSSLQMAAPRPVLICPRKTLGSSLLRVPTLHDLAARHFPCWESSRLLGLNNLVPENSHPSSFSR